MKTSYSAQNPKIWDKSSNAAANFIALQAYMRKPTGQVSELELLRMIDKIILPLLEAKALIDPLPQVPPEIEAEFAPINHTKTLTL